MRAIATFVLLALAIPAVAQEWPRPTEGGKRALDDLIRQCIASGGLKEEKNQKIGEITWTVADADKLKAAVAADQAALALELRDALIARWVEGGERDRPALYHLLQTVGEVTGDRRISAFVSYFTAQCELSRDVPSALAALEEAARQFQACGERRWQAVCLHGIGEIHSLQKKHSEALEYFQKALAVDREALGEKHPRVADDYNDVATLYAQQGEFNEALEDFQKALAIRRTFHGNRHPDVASSLHGIGFAYAGLGDHAGALKAHQEALAIRREVHGDRHPDVAMSQYHLALAYARRGDYRQALGSFEKALATYRTVHGEKHSDVAACLHDIARVYAAQHDYLRALQYLQKTLDIRRAVHSDRHPFVASCIHDIAVAFEQLGESTLALEGHQQALAIYRSLYGDWHPEVAGTLSALATLYAEQGKYSNALRYYNGAMTIYRVINGDKSPKVANCLNGIGSVHALQGDYAQAVEYHRRALAIACAIYGEQHFAVAECHRFIAAAYSQQGDQSRAWEHYRLALASLRGVHPIIDPGVVEIMGDIATACAREGNHAAALHNFELVLEAAREVFGEQDRKVARALLGIANARAQLGEYAQAIEDYQRALVVYRARFGDRNPEIAATLGNMAYVYANQGKVELARKTVNQALDSLDATEAHLRDPVGQRDSTPLGLLPYTAKLLASRAELAELEPCPDLVASLSNYEAAAQVLERVRERFLATESSKLQLGEELAELSPRTVGVAARLARDKERSSAHLAALTAAERGSARVFLETLGRSRAEILGRIDAKSVAEEAELLEKIRQLDNRIDKEQFKTIKERDRETVGKLFNERMHTEEQLQALIARWEREYPQYAALKYPKVCTVEQARACLADSEIAPLYVIGSEASYLVVVAKDDDPKTAGIAIHKLAPAGEIAELVAALMQPAVLEDVDSACELGARAYRMLLAPAADAIRGKGLVIVPGGALGMLPFELLVEPADVKGTAEHYLVEGHRIRYAPSLTALHLVRQWEQSRPRPERPLWAVGDPVYEATDPRLTSPTRLAQETRYQADKYRSGVRGEAFPRLPATGAEVEQLRQFLGADPDEVLVGREATEAAVKATSESGRLAKYRYVHFATHGILGLADGTPPSLVLSLVGDQHGEDGFLTLGEVTGLRLNADLVVLSACQTGQGRLYNAEGVSGLARAFLYAGSRGVLCSLWRVADQETLELMTAVYAGLKEKKTAADALREAQLRMIADGQPPLYWAPFILIGE